MLTQCFLSWRMQLTFLPLCMLYSRVTVTVGVITRDFDACVSGICTANVELTYYPFQFLFTRIKPVCSRCCFNLWKKYFVNVFGDTAIEQWDQYLGLLCGTSLVASWLHSDPRALFAVVLPTHDGPHRNGSVLDSAPLGVTQLPLLLCNNTLMHWKELSLMLASKMLIDQ